MKRLLYLSLAALMVVLAVSCAKDNDVCTIMKDPVFKAYCLERFDTNGDGKIMKDEAEQVMDISVPSMGITSLSGIERFPNLLELDCSSNSIKSLDVSKNLKLIHLDCRENPVEVIYMKSGQTIPELVKKNFVPKRPLRATVYDYFSGDFQESSVHEPRKSFKFKAEFNIENPPESVTWESNAPGFQPVTTQVQGTTAELNFEKGSDIADIEEGKLYKMIAKAPDGTVSNYVRFGIFGKGPIIYFEKPEIPYTEVPDESVVFSVFFYPGEGESGTPSIKTIGEGCNRSFNSGVKIQEDEAIRWSKTGEKKVVVYFEKNGKRTVDTLRVNIVEGLPEIKILD